MTDLRGRSIEVPQPVLLDATGARAKHLRTLGRAAGALFLLWMLGLLLAGLGLFPVSAVPLARSIKAAQSPPRLSVAPTPRKVARADKAPALLPSLRPAPAGAATDRAPAAEAPRKPSVTRRPAPKAKKTPISQSNATPGQKKVAPGRPVTAPVTPAVDKSHASPTQSAAPTAPGHTKTTGTSHGASGSAPGHDPTRTTGNSP